LVGSMLNPETCEGLDYTGLVSRTLDGVWRNGVIIELYSEMMY